MGKARDSNHPPCGSATAGSRPIHRTQSFPPMRKKTDRVGNTAAPSFPETSAWFLCQRNRRWHATRDRKSTRLNSSHDQISYAVFCLKKKKNTDYLELMSDDYLRDKRHRATQSLNVNHRDRLWKVLISQYAHIDANRRARLTTRVAHV